MKSPIEKSLLQYLLILTIVYQIYQSAFDALTDAPVILVFINIILALVLILLLVLVRLDKSINLIAFLLHILVLPAFIYFWYFNGGIDGIVPFIVCVYFGFIIATTNGWLKWISLGLHVVALIMMLYFPAVLGTLKTENLNLDSKPIDFFVIAIVITLFTIYLKDKYMFYRNQIAMRNDQLQRVAVKLIKQNEELERQREEIKAINENLEGMIVEHTQGIEIKNKELSEYAYINAHLLRAPLSRILGLATLMESDPRTYDAQDLDRIKKLATEMDGVVRKINEVLN
jgi:signal transduction histidine kinase